MNITELKEMMLIKDIKTVGDEEHNEYIELLFSDMKNNKICKSIIKFVNDSIIIRGSMRWIHRDFSKAEIKDLNGIATKSNQNNIQVKAVKYFTKLHKTPYKAMFNSRKIKNFIDIFDLLNIDYEEAK